MMQIYKFSKLCACKKTWLVQVYKFSKLSACKKTSLDVDDFGSYKDTSGKCIDVKRFTWNNSSNVTVQVINWGATITSIKLPDKNGKIEDIALGFDTIEEYVGPKNIYLGATMGRVANRIAKGIMTIEGVQHTLSINEDGNHLHGGIKGFTKVMWNYRVNGNKVIMTYLSPEMEEGYPGDLIATITFELKDNNDFKIDYRGIVTKPCPINMSNHSYFNLGGQGAGAKELYKHEITINADRYAELDQDTWIPTGKLPAVSGTIFDLRVPTVMGDVVNKVPDIGYDHNFCVTKGSSQTLAFAAKAYHPPSGRVMEVYSDQPGVQFYTANKIPQNCTGKGATYEKHGAFCFETQTYPNAINQPNFPKVLLYPGEEYHHVAIFKFLVQK